MSSHNIRAPYMLGERHFMLTVGAALLLHLSLFVAWSFAPKQAVQNIIINTMNIRLGEEDEESMTLDKPDAFPANAPQVEAIIDQITGAATPQPQANPDSAKQYVREVNTPKQKTKGAKNGKRDAEIMSRYTQLTSLWVKKFQQYPEEARQQNLQGTAVVRMRIDRRGNVRYYAIERSSGIPQLDHAAIDMIRRANPLPALPDDYPPGDAFEFLIPVIFSLS